MIGMFTGGMEMEGSLSSADQVALRKKCGFCCGPIYRYFRQVDKLKFMVGILH